MILHNTALPITLNDRFCPPDLQDAFEYYPSYIRQSKSEWSFQGYMSYILKQIDKIKPNGYTGDKAFSEWINYNGGLGHLADMVEKFKGLAEKSLKEKQNEKD